ncbi:MAG: YcaO-like family protein [Candidatus Aenigmarchaeota archaeon]|nr:YcaO-like family protein [Candidatus Aenigmarchaeota archaeon]
MQNLVRDPETLFEAYEGLPKESSIPISQLLSYGYHPSFYAPNAGQVFRKKKMMFMKVHCLTDKTEKYLPLFWHLYFYGTNGFASGNTYEEAVLRALCEVI